MAVHLKQHDINAYVPQGLILEPLLFQIFINKLPDKIVSEMRIFADDSMLDNKYKEKKRMCMYLKQ